MENRTVLMEKKVDATKLKGMETDYIIEYAAAKDRKIKDTTAELDLLKAELQRRAEKDLEERNIKFTEFFGVTNSYVNVSYSQKMDVLNMQRVKELLGTGLVEEKVSLKPADVKYEYDKKFRQALIAVVTGDYDNEFSIEQIVDTAGWPMDTKQRSLILKKLKGEYVKDREMLKKILGLEELSADEELYYIYKIKNWELIRAFFPLENFAELASELKKYVIVDETPKIELKYANVPEGGAEDGQGDNSTD